MTVPKTVYVFKAFSFEEPRDTMEQIWLVRWITIVASLIFFFLLFSLPSACWRWGSYKTPPDLCVSGRFTNPGQVDICLFQVFPDIVHPGLPMSPSASLSLYSLHVHVKHLVVFSPPSVPRGQTTVVSFSWSSVPLSLGPQALLSFVHF